MGKAERVFIQDVLEAVFDLNELIKTYQSKNKLSKVLMSTQFKRQQEELDVVVDRAISRLQVSAVSQRALLHPSCCLGTVVWRISGS